MKLLVTGLLFAGWLSAQSIGPWASEKEAPDWWVATHGVYLPQLRQHIPERLLEQFPKATPDTVTVSFEPQGSLSWLPRNVDTDELTICAPAGTSVQAGLIYQLANAHKIQTLSPAIVKSQLYQKQRMNKWEILIDVLGDASIAIPILGQAGGVISLSTKKQVILLGAHAVFDMAKPQVESRLPNPAPTIDRLLDPESVLLFSGACIDATMGVRHRKYGIAGTYALNP
jgi:hypothetical protein